MEDRVDLAGEQIIDPAMSRLSRRAISARSGPAVGSAGRARGRALEATRGSRRNRSTGARQYRAARPGRPSPRAPRRASRARSRMERFPGDRADPGSGSRSFEDDRTDRIDVGGFGIHQVGDSPGVS